MNWHLSHRFDRRALPLADAHYNRQKIGSPQFVAPGRCLVLLTEPVDALWVTSWPKAEFTKHEWAGAWVCSHFRNQSPVLSSALILEAVACTRAIYPDVPELGMITFVDPSQIRHKRDPGRCFIKAGFRLVGKTKIHKHPALQLTLDRMPDPSPPLGPGESLFRTLPYAS